MELTIEKRTYRLTGLTPILGTTAASRTLRTLYVASKAPAPELAAEEAELGPDIEEKGLTIFNRDPEDYICLMEHQIKGYLKSALTALRPQANVAAASGKVDTLVFVKHAGAQGTGTASRYIPILKNGAPVKDEDDVLERPLRAETPRGPRNALQGSEMIEDPWTIEIELSLLPSKGTKLSEALDFERLELALDYGSYHGIGGWRNAGYGRFTWERLD